MTTLLLRPDLTPCRVRCAATRPSGSDWGRTPGERVVDMERCRAPDLLLDNTPGRLRGVEVAARSTGGVGVLTGMRNDKIALIVPRKDVLELHLSLWCGDPRMGLFARVKP